MAEEIIIDGVDVSKCGHYHYGKCEIDYDEWNNEIIRYNECQNNPNCHFKQLKRKEQEYEKLYIQLKANEEYHKEEENTLRKIIKNKEERNIELYKENNKLKQTLTKIKEIAGEQIPYLDIDKAKTITEVEYDYADKIYNLEQRMYKILQKISEVKNEN